AKEINSKLQRIQSTVRFLCVCMIELDCKNNFVLVLNAGLPDILLKGKTPGVKQRYKSDNLPLGVISTSELEPNISHSELQQGDRIYAFTDGLIEVKNENDKCMGLEFIQEKFRNCRNETGLFQEILEGMHQFHGDGRQTDDITLVEITCDENLVRRSHVRSSRKKHKPPMQWSLSLDMGCDLLKREDPLPLLVQLITELQDLDEHREQIYTILSEMFSNALEHGILGLDSGIKQDPEGFARYYDQRERLLEEMEQGKLQFEISNRVVKGGARLTLALQHNGSGFDFRKYLDRIQADPDQAHGRGLLLMRNICSDIRYSDNGRRLELDYTWNHQANEHDD
ncbi:MAG: SpoIIE family protein phosphatase, partial [Gammaproteobacteria bacterium]|nr:SpoIIE family protein phosphatase [Gammaproteobacteria bacterium]